MQEREPAHLSTCIAQPSGRLQYIYSNNSVTVAHCPVPSNNACDMMQHTVLYSIHAMTWLVHGLLSLSTDPLTEGLVLVNRLRRWTSHQQWRCTKVRQGSTELRTISDGHGLDQATNIPLEAPSKRLAMCRHAVPSLPSVSTVHHLCASKRGRFGPSWLQHID